MKRSGIHRKTPLASKSLRARAVPKAADGEVGSPKPARARIKPRSPKRSRDERQYAKDRKVFLGGAVCAVCGRTGDLTVHHKRGRVGADLLDVAHWLPVCWDPCHIRITEHPRWALDNGYSELRTTRRTA
jgi:hypothetical protein